MKHRTRPLVRTGWKLALLATLVVVGAMLAGCVVDDSAPTFEEATPGAVQISSHVHADVNDNDPAEQRLYEYGVFYSTSEEDLVAVSGGSGTSAVGAFTIRPGVHRVRVTVPVDQQVISSSLAETLTVGIPNLSPATTYYFRYYTVGYGYTTHNWMDTVLTNRLFALRVASYTTAPLPVIKTSIVATGPASVYRYKPYSLSGSVVSTPTPVWPASGKVKLVFKRYVSGAWRQVGTANYITLNSGAFSYILTPGSRGKWRAYISYPGRTTNFCYYKPTSLPYRSFTVK